MKRVVKKWMRSIACGAIFALASISVVAQSPFSSLEQTENGWRNSEWYGWVWDTAYPWVYSVDHDWQYFNENEAGRFSVWDPNMGWLFTSEELYPNLYSFIRNSWLLFSISAGDRRAFWEYSMDETLSYPKGRPPPVSGRNGFKFTFSLVDTSEILSGGPGRDGIPAIHNPGFESIETADSYMGNDDVVLSVSHGGETRAYPFRILNWHEIVNDRIGDLHFSATYCPLCGTAMVFDRTINGTVHSFGVSGLLHRDNVLMYDLRTWSLWNQLALRAQTGAMFNTRLKWLPSTQMRYERWKEKFPSGTVLSTDTGFSRNYARDPYSGYFGSPWPLFYNAEDARTDLPQKAWVFGILLGEEARAYPKEALKNTPSFVETVAGQTLSIAYDADNEFLRITNSDTDEEIRVVASFWFAWQAFYPETSIYGQ